MHERLGDALQFVQDSRNHTINDFSRPSYLHDVQVSQGMQRHKQSTAYDVDLRVCLPHSPGFMSPLG